TGPIRERPLLADVREEPAGDAASEDLVGDADLRPPVRASLWCEQRGEDVGLDALRSMRNDHARLVGQPRRRKGHFGLLRAGPSPKVLLRQLFGLWFVDIPRDDQRGGLGDEEARMEIADVWPIDPRDVRWKGAVPLIRLLFREELVEDQPGCRP